MPSLRSVAAIAALVAGMMLVALGWMAPGPPRVNIRWSAETGDQAREDAERSLHLTGGARREGRTWSYLLLETSTDNVGRILDHPAVEDRHYFGPGRTLAPEAPPLQAWFQARYGRPPANWVAATWWFVGPTLCVVAIAAAWPQLSAFAAEADLRLVAVLVVSGGLRLWLIFSGGQYYWPDEKRYRGAQRLVAGIASGDTSAWREAMSEPSSLLFKLVGTVPAAIERLIGDNPTIPALFLGTCSLVIIWLLAAIARRLDATRDEAFLAAFLAACSASLLYFSRHLLSYDLALMLGLIGVFTGVNRGGGRAASLLTSVWAMASFLAYAGSWTLAGAVCVIHVADARDIREAVRRAWLLVAGFVSIVIALMLGYHAAGLSWLALLGTFAGTITQGDFSEGWRLPFEYLWDAEHLLLIVWLAAVAWSAWRFRASFESRLARAGLVGAVCVYAALALSSTAVERFVVYGRLSRPLVPFLCLLSAAAIGIVIRRGMPGSRPRAVVLVTVVLAMTVQGAVNLRVPVHQEFPAEFIARAERQFPEPRLFVNARHLYPAPDAVSIPSGYREVLRAAHPLQFAPYQYEGYTSAERRVLRTSDIRMRVFVGAH